MEIGRIKYLREELEAERIDLEELSEIETAFAQLPDEQLRDLGENAMASDMLDELEAAIPEIAWKIYDYVCENYGENEADDPSWAITPLAEYLTKEGYSEVAKNG